MNIFEENKKKYEIKSKGDMAKMGLAFIMGGGFLSIFVITAIIGIPLILIGFLVLLAAPFWKPNGKAKSLKETWEENKERDKKLLAKVKQIVQK